MTNELIPAGILAELNTLSSEELRRQLTVSLNVTAQQLLRMAAIVRILEERGDDLSDIRGALPGYLRRIAYGQMLAEVVVRFADSQQLVKRISQLPIPDQRRLAAGEPIEVAVVTDQGTERRMVDPLNLRGPLLAQVFASDHIRTLPEQVAIIEARRLVAPKPRQPRSRVRGDRELGGIFVGRAFAKQEEVLQALAELQPEPEADDGAGGMVPITVHITAADHRHLKVRAAQAGCTLQDLYRRALAAAGLIRST